MKALALILTFTLKDLLMSLPGAVFRMSPGANCTLRTCDMMPVIVNFMSGHIVFILLNLMRGCKDGPLLRSEPLINDLHTRGC